MFASLALSRTHAALALLIGAVAAGACYAFGPETHRFYGIPLSFLLAWAAVVDIDRFILPDFLTFGLMIGGITVAATQGQGVLIDHAIGLAAGYLFLLGVEVTYRALRKRDGLGRGDAKLLGAAGAWLGWSPLALVLLFASLAGLAAALVMALQAKKLDGTQAIAFGPFIALGFWAAYTFPDAFPVFSLSS